MRTFGLIGHPLSHSFSQQYLTEKFKVESINDSEYKAFELADIDKLPALVKDTSGLQGLNVTIPHKQDVMRFMDHLSDDAKAIGAVNTIEFKDGSFVGHNTDWLGFTNAIKPFLENRKKALVLGTGGASKAIQYALKKLNISCELVSRGNGSGLQYSDLNTDILSSHDILINCTPLGTYPNTDDCPNIPYGALSSQHLCFDLVYNPEITEFMKRSSAQGASVSNGYQMLVNQAEEAWRIWNR